MLDDGQLRLLEERLAYLRDLEERRFSILRTIGDQGKLTDALHQSILAARTKAEFDDHYVPYRRKRRVRAQVARVCLWNRATVRSRVVEGEAGEGAKFLDCFEVNQTWLGRKLDAVVEDCVTAVGANINTAFPALLRPAAGLTSSLADSIVNYYDRNGSFRTSKAIASVSCIGKETFEQAAGFLRIPGGDNPFVDIGIHHDGLVYVSALSHGFVRDPREVVKAGQTVKVKVRAVGLARRRISLRLRLDDDIALPGGAARPVVAERNRPGTVPGKTGKASGSKTRGAMAKARAAALKKS